MDVPLIKALKAGLTVTDDQLEAHYLAGGNVDRVIDALIMLCESLHFHKHSYNIIKEKSILKISNLGRSDWN